jgi:thioredoxin
MSNTVNITSAQHFSQVLSSSRIVVTDFWAEWCGPCKTVAPVYEQLSTQLSRPGTITFTKVNTDEQRDIAQTYNVSALPTFMIFKAGREVKRIRGANPKELDAAVKQLAQEAGKADEDGAGESSSAGGRWTGAAAPKGYSDITDAVDVLGVDCLNLDGEKGDKRMLFDTSKPSSLGASGKQAESSKSDWLQSDTDEQLMLFIPFQSTVKLHSLHITSIPPAEADDDEAPSRPKTLKLYTNRSTTLGFDEADDTTATQELTIKESDWDSKTGTAKVELRFVKFQNISSLVIFVVESEGDNEKTRIDRIRLFGETGEKRAMGKLEKIGDEQGE